MILCHLIALRSRSLDCKTRRKKETVVSVEIEKRNSKEFCLATTDTHTHLDILNILNLYTRHHQPSNYQSAIFKQVKSIKYSIWRLSNTHAIWDGLNMNDNETSKHGSYMSHPHPHTHDETLSFRLKSFPFYLDLVRAANKLLNKCKIEKQLNALTELDSKLLVTIYENICATELVGMFFRLSKVCAWFDWNMGTPCSNIPPLCIPVWDID